MDEKVKNDEKKVMLVRQTGEGQDGKLKAVGSIDEDGNIKTLDPTAANVAKLFDVHTNQPALEAFFTKFMEQSQDPVKTGISEIFIMAESVLEKLIKIDLDPQRSKTTASIRPKSSQKWNSRSRFPVSSLWIYRKSTWRVWSAWVSVWKTSNPI